MQNQRTSGPRRVKTKAPGVYRSISGKYEIAYRDSDGRLRFEVVGTSFEDAKAARAEKIDKLRKGETIRPTRQTFAAFAEAWLDGLNKRPRTIEAYRYALDHHLLPEFRRRRLAEIGVNDVARLIAKMERKGLSGWTIHGTLTTLSAILRRAVREGAISSNPVSKLDRGERPKLGGGEKRTLSSDEITRVLNNAGTFKPLAMLLAFTGLRLGEALGLTWADIDFERGFVHVRAQLDRSRERVELKTEAGRREVLLMLPLAAELRRHRDKSPYKGPSDFVFAAPDGRGRDHRSTSRAIERLLKRAGLAGQGFSAHSFRHTYASMLIVELGWDAVTVSKQLGHSSPVTTMRIYAHAFDRARRTEAMRDALNERFARLGEAAS